MLLLVRRCPPGPCDCSVLKLLLLPGLALVWPVVSGDPSNTRICGKVSSTQMLLQLKSSPTPARAMIYGGAQEFGTDNHVLACFIWC